MIATFLLLHRKMIPIYLKRSFLEFVNYFIINLTKLMKNTIKNLVSNKKLIILSKY